MRSLFLGGSDGRTDGLTAGRTYGRTPTAGRTDGRTGGRTADGRPFRQAYAIDGSSARRARHDQIKVKPIRRHIGTLATPILTVGRRWLLRGLFQHEMEFS